MQKYYLKLGKSLIKFFVIKTSLIYKKSLALSLLTGIIITSLEVILKSIDPKSWLVRNNIYQASKKISKLMLKTIISIYF